MSWLSTLMQKIPEDNNSSTENSSQKTDLYICVESTRVCFLSIDENVHPNTIVDREEFYLGPIEELEEGKPVRDIFGSLLKLFTAHKDKFDNRKNISVAIPAEGVFFKNIEVPKMEPSDMQRLLLSEIKKTLPVDFSEVLFAQNDLGTTPEKMQKFFCVGIQKLYFENFKSLFAKFDITPYFEIEVFSLSRIMPRDKVHRIIVQIERTNSYLIFLEGQIVQDVKLLDVGLNDLNNNVFKDLGVSFKDVEELKKNYTRLQEDGKMSVKILDEYMKDINKKMSKYISMNIIEYEKKHGIEIDEVVISGIDLKTGLKKNILEEFDAELKVNYLGPDNFGEYVSENFTLEELKRYAQCFGLALRAK